LSWLLLGLLGIIWAAFLIPSRKRSPASSVEDFERRMSLLAEANNTVPGRWVLMPRKGARLIGSRDRERIRARRRRRQIFMVLLESTVLTLLMGIFPPFRIMLYGTGFLAFVLLAYAALLVKLREDEIARARLRLAMERRRASEAATPAARARTVAASARYAAQFQANGNGHAVHATGNGNGHANGRVPAYANGNGHSNGNGHANGNGNGNGHVSSHSIGNGNGHSNGNGRTSLSDILREGGVEIIEDDVHVIVRRASDLAGEGARSSAQ
jgi:hypothetical protein